MIEHVILVMVRETKNVMTVQKITIYSKITVFNLVLMVIMLLYIKLVINVQNYAFNAYPFNNVKYVFLNMFR